MGHRMSKDWSNVMIVENFKEELFNLLYTACLNDISSIKKDLLGKHVFSYSIYCDSGFTGFGGAACSREGIEKYINKTGDDSYIYAETFAAQWDYVNRHWEYFSNFDKLNENIIEAADDGEIEGIITVGDFSFDMLFQFYIDLIIDVLNKLKKQKAFNDNPFEQDLLLGLQFGSPSEQERKMIISVSEKVNSPEWHQKMLEAYSS